MGPSALTIMLKDVANLRAHILAVQGEGDIGLEKADLVAAIEALALEAQAVEGRAADLLGEGVGELHLAAGTALLAAEMLEDRGLEDIAADHREGRRRLRRTRLFHQIAHGDEVRIG